MCMYKTVGKKWKRVWLCVSFSLCVGVSFSWAWMMELLHVFVCLLYFLTVGEVFVFDLKWALCILCQCTIIHVEVYCLLLFVVVDDGDEKGLFCLMAGAVPDPEVRQLYFPCGGLAQVPHPHVLWHSSLYPSSAFPDVYLCISFQALFNICWWLCINFCWWLHLLSDYVRLWQAYLCWLMCCCWWQYIYSLTVHLLTIVHLLVAVRHCLTKYEHLLMAVKCSHWPVFFLIQTFTHSHRPVLL